MDKSLYRSEMKKMKQNRKKYLPAVISIMDLYKKNLKTNIEITEQQSLCTLVELVDIGYLDGKVVVIKKYFDDIEKIIYTGGYPLTPAGEKFLDRELKNKEKKELLVRIIILLTFIFGISLALLIYNNY